MRRGISWLVGIGAALAAGAGSALAEPVTLTSLDGVTSVSGELIGFDGQSYTVQTSLGIISVAAGQVTCSGSGCPQEGGTPAPAATVEAPAATPAAPAPVGGAFTLSGSNVIGDGLMPALVDGYAESLGADVVRQVGAAENERAYRLTRQDGSELATIRVVAHGTASAFPALASGDAALGLASRRMNGAEGGLPDLAGGPEEQILALDGLAVITHAANPVRSLTLDQIAAIFAGRTTNWSQLGGPDRAISLYLPTSGSGTLEQFNRLVMEPRRLEAAQNAERLEDHADLSDLVSIDPGGIGLTSFAFVRAARVVAIRQLCGLVSYPTSFSLKTEEYPLARRLYVYGSGRPLPPQAKGLLDFMLSDTAQPLIAESGFVDRDIEAQGIDVQGARIANSLTSPEEFSLPLMRDMLNELKDAERLSLTFRFNAGSSDLEARSQSEAERFARLIAGGSFAGKEILLVGFADSVGDFNVNRGLAERRAQTVLDTLKTTVGEAALAAVPILVQSYGELTPVGCNETAEGRELNRRVEVWVRERTG